MTQVCFSGLGGAPGNEWLWGCFTGNFCKGQINTSLVLFFPGVILHSRTLHVIRSWWKSSTGYDTDPGLPPGKFEDAVDWKGAFQLLYALVGYLLVMV